MSLTITEVLAVVNPSLRCPLCTQLFIGLDGHDWTLTAAGDFKIACSCGAFITGKITVKAIISTRRPQKEKSA